jgi:oligoribonuclease NrnB/cAMP/cGMP phosphodiesterase (DHH superfamily)
MLPQINRIVAHTDFDGLISALLMQEVLGVEEVAFAESWEITDGSFIAHHSDAVVDLPCPGEGCALWIDHHASNNGPTGPYFHLDSSRKSCASFIHSLWPDRLQKYLPLVQAADIIDSAEYAERDIREPMPAMQVALSLAHGSHHYRAFLIEQLRNRGIEDVAAMRIVQEKYAGVMREHEEFLVSAEERIAVRGSVLVLDGMGLQVPGGLLHFMLYLRYPAVAVSLIISDGGQGRARVSLGENIFMRVNNVNLGMLAREYGGGGHKAAAGCSVPLAQKDEMVDRLVTALNQ